MEPGSGRTRAVVAPSPGGREAAGRPLALRGAARGWRVMHPPRRVPSTPSSFRSRSPPSLRSLPTPPPSPLTPSFCSLALLLPALSARGVGSWWERGGCSRSPAPPSPEHRPRVQRLRAEPQRSGCGPSSGLHLAAEQGARGCSRAAGAPIPRRAARTTGSHPRLGAAGSRETRQEPGTCVRCSEVSPGNRGRFPLRRLRLQVANFSNSGG